MAIEPETQQALANALFNSTGILYLAKRLDFQVKADKQREELGVELSQVLLQAGGFGFESWEAALENFMAKVPTLDRGFFLDLADDLKVKYFNIARIEEDYVIEWVGREIERSITDGILIDEFKDNIASVMDNAGITPLNPWHADLVYKQNLSNAYAAGRYDQWNIPENLEFYPSWQYIATLVNTRPSHKALHLTVFAFGDGVGDSYMPPNGFNCRCQSVPVDKITAEEEGIRPSTEIPTYEDPEGNLVVATPDEGFFANPSQSFRSIPEV